jgi:hypothetical protein
MVKQGRELVQATVDSFEDAVHRRSPDDPTVLREHQGKATWQVPQGQLFATRHAERRQAGRRRRLLLPLDARLGGGHAPELIRDAITDNGDGTYTVTFHVPPGFDALKAIGPAGGLLQGTLLGLSQKLNLTPDGKTVQVTVDGDVPTLNGQNLYARRNGQETGWHHGEGLRQALGQLRRHGNGGSPSTAMYALTGKPTHSHSLTPTSALGLKLGDVRPSAARCNEVFADLKVATDAGQLVVANTYQSDSQAPAGLVGGHSYTVLGTSERDGQRFVQLRNPWGHREPGTDGQDDGIFELPIEQFATVFASYNVGEV